MNYMNLIESSCVDFTGWSTVLQVSGCAHKCKGCFAKASHNKNSGSLFDEDAYQELYTAASKPYISNIVMQGGDMMFSANYKEGIALCRRLKKELPDKNIVLFTGYTYEQLQNDLLRQSCLFTIDYLMDGKYEQDNPTTKPFRGSANQILHKIVKGVSVEQS